MVSFPHEAEQGRNRTARKDGNAPAAERSTTDRAPGRRQKSLRDRIRNTKGKIGTGMADLRHLSGTKQSPATSGSEPVRRELYRPRLHLGELTADLLDQCNHFVSHLIERQFDLLWARTYQQQDRWK
jgi:hypothetical protein